MTSTDEATDTSRERALDALGRLGRAEDVKLAAGMLEDLADALEVLGAHDSDMKVTVFGSARLREHTPAWEAAFDLSRRLASQGFVVITGGGPGVMTAGLEGAGAAHAVGVTIDLPFEDEKVGPKPWPTVSQGRFFTRKLAMVRRTRGVVGLPGGFGTLDEMFEVLTLVQTGKKQPVPVVFLDEPGGSLWSKVDELATQLQQRGLIGAHDKDLYLVTDSVDAAVAEIIGFWRNYAGLTHHDDGSSTLKIAATVEPSALAAVVDAHPEVFHGRPLVVHGAVHGRLQRRNTALLRRLIDDVNRL